MNIDQNRAKVGQPIDKIWGQTRCISRGHGFEVHYLEIKANRYCSRHKHRAKWNEFYVLSGTLLVRYYDKHGTHEETRILNAGCRLDVPPGQIHRFESVSDCRCIEIYWTDPVDPSDIDRLDEGGILAGYEHCEQETKTEVEAIAGKQLCSQT